MVKVSTSASDVDYRGGMVYAWLNNKLSTYLTIRFYREVEKQDVSNPYAA